jgi:hypothetical protein
MPARTGWPWDNEMSLETERGSTRSHTVGEFWRRLWSCRKTDYMMMMMMMMLQRLLHTVPPLNRILNQTYSDSLPIILSTFIITSVCATCHAYLIILDFITVIIFREGCKLGRFTECSFMLWMSKCRLTVGRQLDSCGCRRARVIV